MKMQENGNLYPLGHQQDQRKDSVQVQLVKQEFTEVTARSMCNWNATMPPESSKDNFKSYHPSQLF